MNPDQPRPFQILVVDDDPTSSLILARSMRSAGFDVTIAESGQKAVDLANSGKFDAVLLDMLMPGMDGFSTCRTLKSSPVTASIPVLFVTAVSDTARLLEAFAAGGCDYITKPFRTDEVLARVSVHVRLRRAEVELEAKNRRTEELAQQLASVNAKLAMLSRIDPLTKLMNRRAWTKVLRQEERRRRRYGHPYSLVMIDVDYFKQYNDSMGHPAGDECLRQVARTIASVCRETDFPARYGGEEFVVLAPNTPLDAGTNLAERIRRAIWDLEMHHPRSAVANRVTISAGVATAENDACEEVLRRADVGLYAAKGGGRNMVFAIPAGQVPSVSAAETRREARSSDGKGAAADVRVLIVDDNATNRAICRIALQRAGYTVAEAVDGVHALAEVQRSAPDLILMDVAMPNMDGLECTKCLKEHPTTNEIPIIIVSAKADSADIVAGLQVGADEYITKPIRTDEVVLRVRSMARLFRERKELVRSYRIRGEQVRILHRLVEYCRCLGASQTMSEALQHICRAAVEIAVCRKAAVFLPDRAGDLLVMAESVGFHRVPSSMLAGQGVIGQVFSSGLPVIVNTNENQAGSAAADGRMLGPGPFVVVQIATGKEIMGVLALGDRAKGEPFGPHDLEHIELMAKIAASTLLGISSRVRDQEGCDAILMALAKLAEHRDSDTGRHVDRVTEYATMIAEELKRCGHFPEELDDEYIAGLRRAVPLHDIGKVAISDDILRKPGKLSESEMRIMRTHASIGAETIEAVMCRTPGVKFLQLAYDVVHGHHEWWDGSGYPRGLRGKEIPLAARITAVADVYDALTTKRVYKEAIAHDRAVAIITNLSGSQFDPMVIEAFLARERDFRALSPAEESVSAAAMQTAQSAL